MYVKKKKREKVEGGWPGAEGGEMEGGLMNWISALQCENFGDHLEKNVNIHNTTKLYTLNG